MQIHCIRKISNRKTNLRRLLTTKKILWAVLIVLYSESLTASSFHFLKFAYSPRIAALAGANTAQFGDVAGIFINPAGLAYLDRHEISLNVMDHLLDFKGGMLGYTCPTIGWGNVSLGMLYLDYGNFDEIDKYGTLTGRSFGAKDFAFAVSYAYRIDGSLAFGANLKYIYSSLGPYHAAAVATDLGILYQPPFIKGTSVGLAFLNSGHNFEPYHEIKEHLPFMLKLGISQRFASLPVSLHANLTWDIGDKDDPNASPVTFSVGSEYCMFERMTFRFGYDHGKRRDLSDISTHVFTGFAFGIGIHLEHNTLDYSINDYGPLGTVHRFGVSFHFSKIARSREDTVEEPIILNPPQNVVIISSNSFHTLSWKTEKGMSYNVYARHADQVEWTKITPKPISNDKIDLIRSKRSGRYFFVVTTVKGNNESHFSIPVSVMVVDY